MTRTGRHHLTPFIWLSFKRVVIIAVVELLNAKLCLQVLEHSNTLTAETHGSNLFRCGIRPSDDEWYAYYRKLFYIFSRANLHKAEHNLDCMFYGLHAAPTSWFMLMVIRSKLYILMAVVKFICRFVWSDVVFTFFRNVCVGCLHCWLNIPRMLRLPNVNHF